ncbi:MAG: signal peptidase I [Intrasporangium sp.]|uniref:signal peptidase I n=1 Tax=Intrasporangium sp. TaxID=1925024 RepID=UPI003F80CD6B
MALATHPLPGRHAAPARARLGRPARSTAYGMALSRLVRGTATLALAIGGLAFLGLAVGPHVLGYRTVTMLTGSMSPTINPGDVVIAMPKPANEVAVGDVLTYEIPVQDRRVETHRVVKVSKNPARQTVIVTKGDANDGVDPWTATIEDQTVWETKAVVPWVGSAIRALRDPTVHAVLLWGAAGGLVLVGLWQIWTPGRHEDDGARG